MRGGKPVIFTALRWCDAMRKVAAVYEWKSVAHTSSPRSRFSIPFFLSLAFSVSLLPRPFRWFCRQKLLIFYHYPYATGLFASIAAESTTQTKRVRMRTLFLHSFQSFLCLSLSLFHLPDFLAGIFSMTFSLLFGCVRNGERGKDRVCRLGGNLIESRADAEDGK